MQEAYVCGGIDLALYSASGKFIVATHAQVIDQVTGPFPAESFDVSWAEWVLCAGP